MGEGLSRFNRNDLAVIGGLGLSSHVPTVFLSSFAEDIDGP